MERVVKKSSPHVWGNINTITFNQGEEGKDAGIHEVFFTARWRCLCVLLGVVAIVQAITLVVVIRSYQGHIEQIINNYYLQREVTSEHEKSIQVINHYISYKPY